MNQNILKRYYQYSKERFPLKYFILLSAIFAASASISTQVYLYGKIENLLSIFLATFALLLFFLRLRLFDEFKDFKHDLVYYPTRPIPRGLVKLQELTVIIFIVLFFEVIIAASKGAKTLVPFLIALSYSSLMLKEFFVKDWLRRHFTVYIISHEILLFPLFFYIYILNGLTLGQIGQSYFWFLTVFLGSQLFLLEVARKTRPKNLEIPSRDTYTAQYGFKGTFLLLSFLGIITVLAGIFTEKILYSNISILTYILSVILIGFLFSVLRFAQYPNEINARKLFTASILFILLIDLVLITNIFIRSYGKIYF
jgi:hypothetical protein